ncbi:DUF1543 domain-containing protein [Pedobacter punctiformis]|uniref:DUF1543 domain-containing protein n=1 Tax=Pedobacter punctiformis TaxID=3004097 RepID=A0ABT4L607_9SPHI|nr:DUF1543 domain-containing protein [Pedobacter sp. HCMS5-2]MCZ4243354.1 DUF1543 domain-containing protein [Pedobacter sp. HCMS5-2]
MEQQKLFMLMLGCKPEGRQTEQHDIFFGIGSSLDALIPDIFAFWPEAKDKIHVDAWREVNYVEGCKVEVVTADEVVNNKLGLFFINLGGYRPDEFDEPHYKMILATTDKATAIKQAKETAFYKHTGFEGAPSHIDDKYGVDVDDVFEISDVLTKEVKSHYKLKLTATDNTIPDKIHLGYLPLRNIQ